MFKLGFYVPADNLEPVKAAVFAAGAGRIGNYDCCCWQIQGQGQFRPLDGSQPYIGSTGQVHPEDEFRVEMVCDDHLIRTVVAALKDAHPYEEVAYDVVRLEDF